VSENWDDDARSSVIGQQFLIEPHGDVQRETNLVVVILLWWRGARLNESWRLGRWQFISQEETNTLIIQRK